MDHSQAPAELRIAYPPGLSPDKWLRRMSERHAEVRLTASLIDLAAATIPAVPKLLRTEYDIVFVREPAAATRSAPAGLARIPLYSETMAVVVPREHEASLFTELSMAELDGERWLDPVDPLRATSVEVSATMELVAANVGLARMPLPLARSFSRRDVVVVPVAVEAETRMGVCWLPDRGEEPAIADFIGIVRGRTANTSRGEDAAALSGGGKTRGASSSRAGATGREKNLPASRTSGRRRQAGAKGSRRGGPGAPRRGGRKSGR